MKKQIVGYNSPANLKTIIFSKIIIIIVFNFWDLTFKFSIIIHVLC